MIAAIVPAAGHSQRMGRPKLILPVGGRTVIARVVSALRDGGASPVLVVSPPADAAGADALRREAETGGAEVLVPAERPPDMRASVEHALACLARRGHPPAAVLLAPADSPGLSADLVALVIERSRRDPGSIVVPAVGGRRGHPIALPWEVALGITRLPSGVGVNALLALRAAGVVEVPTEDPGILDDLDTPDDYRRWAVTEPG